jgi:hypothetical protein
MSAESHHASSKPSGLKTVSTRLVVVPQREMAISGTGSEVTRLEGVAEHIGLDHLAVRELFIAGWVSDTFSTVTERSRGSAGLHPYLLDIELDPPAEEWSGRLQLRPSSTSPSHHWNGH